MTDPDRPAGLWNLQSLVTGSTPPPGSPPPPPVSQPEPPPVQQAPPPWTPPPVTPQPVRPPGRSPRMMIALGSAAAVLLVAAGTTIALRSSAGADETPPAPVPTVTVAPAYTPDYAAEPTTTEPAPAAPAEDPQDTALAELARLHDEDLPTVTFQGQYVAQIASKNPGIPDPYQLAADGTHIFQATDILAEHLALRAETSENARVVLLLSTDYGKRQLVNGKPLWVTFALGDFTSKQDVLDWCARRFPDMSADELKNQCAARKLDP